MNHQIGFDLLERRMFRIGQKVVCVDADRPIGTWVIGSDSGVKRGAIYTVATVGLTHVLDPDNLPCIEVIELPGRSIWAHRFRPIVERKTDISFAHEILRRESIPDECIPAEYGVDWGASA